MVTVTPVVRGERRVAGPAPDESQRCVRDGIGDRMLASVVRRVVDPFVPPELQADSEKRRIARLLICASAAAAPITLALAVARWIVDGTRSRIGALAGIAVCAFAMVPFVV